jgi:hypothetical protein
MEYTTDINGNIIPLYYTCRDGVTMGNIQQAVRYRKAGSLVSGYVFTTQDDYIWPEYTVAEATISRDRYRYNHNGHRAVEVRCAFTGVVTQHRSVIEACHMFNDSKTHRWVASSTDGNLHQIDGRIYRYLGDPRDWSEAITTKIHRLFQVKNYLTGDTYNIVAKETMSLFGVSLSSFDRACNDPRRGGKIRLTHGWYIRPYLPDIPWPVFTPDQIHISLLQSALDGFNPLPGDTMTAINQNFRLPPPVKIMINIGALLDIPTGKFLKGAKGESLLLGGLPNTVGLVGQGNTYKSTIMHAMMLSAADRLSSTVETSMSTYDTEVNIHEDRLRHFASQYDSFKERDIISDGTWCVTDKTVYYANEWFENLKDFLKQKETNAKKLEYDTPFLSRDMKTPLKVVVPTFSEIDSFSEFETSDVAKMQDDNELGNSGSNTLHMKSGANKVKFLMALPNLLGSSNHFMLMTCHIGKEINMASGPYAAPPKKKLQHMGADERLKGVPDKFLYLMAAFWHAFNVSPLMNQGTKGPEYPKDSDDNVARDTDLNLVSLKQLRSKSGPSGIVVQLVVSQIEGVLPSLTEFHYIKEHERFGITGSLQNYVLDLYPECKLSRTAVRGKIDADAKLRRALNITSELCQMNEYYRYMEDLPSPKEIYDWFTERKISMDLILTQTRGWWTLNNDAHPSLHFLSTKDITDMVRGRYWPYWMAEDGTVLPAYLKKA